MMKPGKYAIPATMLVLFLGIVAYFGIYIYHSFSNTVEVFTAYQCTEEDRTEVSGFLVREERIIDQAPGGLMEVMLDEGEKVGVGGVVARIYSSEDAVARQKEINALETELAQLQALEDSSRAAGDAMTLDTQIKALMGQVHQSVGSGVLDGLRENADQLKDLAFRRDYLYNGDTNLSDGILEVGNRLAALQSQMNADTQYVTTQISGIYSGSVDGYENILTPDKLENLTASTLSGWAELMPDASAQQYIGKLVTNQRWYFAALMDAEDAQRMGSTVTLRFTSTFKTNIVMDVESVSEEENGKVAVVLSSNKYLSQTGAMRYQAADVVYQSTSGIMVPVSAVRMQTTEDEEKGTVSQEGVYVIVGNRAEWKPVEVVYNNGEYCVVNPLDENDADSLHAGDTVIAKGRDIFDGKVIEQ